MYQDLECLVAKHVFIHKENHQDKLSPKARKMIFLGYPAGVKGYKFFDPQSRRIVITSSATFNEFSFPKCSNGDDEPDLIIPEDDNNLETEDHQDQEEENTEDAHGNPRMDITFDQDLLPNLDLNPEQQLEICTSTKNTFISSNYAWWNS